MRVELDEHTLLSSAQHPRLDATSPAFHTFHFTAMPSSGHSPVSPTKSTYGYEVAPDYPRSPVRAQPPFSAGGYPYMPHNPTLQEVEAYNARIGAVKARQASFSHSIPSGSSDVGGRGARNGSVSEGNQLGNAPRPRPIVPFPADLHLSSGEEEESDGPDTPYSARNYLWQDWVTNAPKIQDPPPHANRKVMFSRYKYDSAPKPQQPDAPPMKRAPSAESELADLSALSSGSEPDASAPRPPSSTALTEIKDIIYEFNMLVLGFRFPSNLEFLPPASNKDCFPQVAHTPASKALLEHTHRLEKLLERLDGVVSNGDASVKRARKDAVDRLIGELERLKRLQAMAWHNQLYKQSSNKA